MRLLGSSSRVVFSVVTPAAALVAPAPAYAVEYLTAEQAQTATFPEAQRFDLVTLTLDDGARGALEARLGTSVKQHWPVRLARRGGQLVGAIVVDDVIGKFERITFAVGVGTDGAIRQIEILSYRESHGQEVRLPAWRQQFVGKTAESSLELGADISNISGATLSCRHVTAGVRRIVAVLDALHHQGALR
jgi:Na+-translocating ferredoxin:NAD+ oxidoreductase RnfG subunit